MALYCSFIIGSIFILYAFLHLSTRWHIWDYKWIAQNVKNKKSLHSANMWIAEFLRMMFLRAVTLMPASLLKHIFIDTYGISSRPHMDSRCWQGMEDQLCRFVECWWALTPQGPLLGNSNNSEPAHASLLKKKYRLVAIAIVFFICFKWLSLELCCDTGQKLIFCFQLPRKKANHSGTASEYVNSEMVHICICIWEYKSLWIPTKVGLTP